MCQHLKMYDQTITLLKTGKTKEVIAVSNSIGRSQILPT